MDALSLPDLKELSRHGGGPLVSFYMPTQRFGPDSQLENVGHLKNLLKTAATDLAAAGVRQADADTLLEPVRRLAEDRPFWLRAEEGLALFADGGLRFFRLPVAPSEAVFVADRFYLRPLLSLLGSDRHYYLLTLSQKHARLLRGTASQLEEVTLGDAPASLAEALKWDNFEKRSLQFHTGTTGAPGGRRPAVFHGSGEPDPKDEIVRYFRGIDHALHELIHDEAPLVLAGVDYLLPLYREVNTYPALASDVMSGNPDSLGDVDLHRRSLAIAAKSFAAGRTEAADRVDDLWATPRATSDPETFVPAAIHGRIEALFVSSEATVWGSVNESADVVSVSPVRQEGDEDLLDLAALRTILAGGDVFSVPRTEMPRDTAAVALLRY